jgi:hypothetical protein
LVPRYATSTVLVVLTATWVALLLACAWIPAYPVLGTPAVITLASIVSSALTAPFLGPLWGGISGFAFGWLVPAVNPSTSIGLLTFLSPMMAALLSGLVLFDRWKEAAFIFGLELAVWFANPFAWYQAMPVITWNYWIVLGFIIVPPVRKWIIDSVKSRNPARLVPALFCLALIARIGGDVATGNNVGVWVLGWGTPEMYPFWVPLTVYYAVADTLNCFVGASIGSAVLLALKRANMRVLAIDYA